MILIKNNIKSLVVILLFLVTFPLLCEDVLRPEGEISSAYNDYYNWSPPVNIGIEAGITYNYFKFNKFSNLPGEISDAYSQGNGIAPYALAIIDYRLNGFLGLQFGIGYQQVNYSNKANTIDFSYSGLNNFEPVNIETNWNKQIGYLHSRLVLRYNLSHKINFNLGGFLNYKLLESDFKNNINNNILADTLLYSRKIYEAYSSEKTEKIIFGITAGAEYRYYLTNDLYLNIHGQYQFSFKNAMQDSKIFPRFEKIYQFFEITGRQNQLFSLGFSLIYKY